jgi:hypothetical protein
MAAPDLFIVRAKVPYGTVTYNCPTAEWALRKLRDFQAAGYESISITAPDGTALHEADLVSILDGAATTAYPAATHP